MLDKNNCSENFGNELRKGHGIVSLRKKDELSMHVIAVGDLDFHAETFIAMRQNGATYLFENIVKELQTADLRIANLETILVESAYSVLGPRAHLISDLSAINGIKSVGFDVVTLANNHTMDAGEEGLKGTINALADAGIGTVGAGMNEKEARKPIVLYKKGIAVYVYAYSFKTCDHIANINKAGCAEAILRNIVEDMKKSGQEEGIKIVNLHMDAEFQALPSPDRVLLCRKIVEAGAQLVLCHHPHVIQGIEIYQGSLIAYSLGNFVTPISNYMREHSCECHLSFQLEVDVSITGVDSVKVLPITLDHEGRPHVANKPEFEKIISMIASRSDALHDRTKLDSCYREMTKKYCLSLFRSIYWGIRYFNWKRINLYLLDVKNTPQKQKWIRDFILRR